MNRSVIQYMSEIAAVPTASGLPKGDQFKEVKAEVNKGAAEVTSAPESPVKVDDVEYKPKGTESDMIAKHTVAFKAQTGKILGQAKPVTQLQSAKLVP